MQGLNVCLLWPCAVLGVHETACFNERFDACCDSPVTTSPLAGHHLQLLPLHRHLVSHSPAVRLLCPCECQWPLRCKWIQRMAATPMNSPTRYQRLPVSIWVLGLVSMCMDISSEMIHSLLPLFLVGSLGASALTVGLMEGLAESTALVTKVFSGALSDYLGQRKGLTVFGYALGALTKPLFAVAPSAVVVLIARLLDRLGKGVRGAPRDAMVADLSAPEMRGAAFGLRQSLDTLGALLGPLLAVGLMLLWGNNFRAVFWVALIPGLLAVALLVVGVREPERQPGTPRSNPMTRDNLRRLSAAYWWVVGIGAVFTLARFSEAFLVLRTQQVGVPIAYVPLVMVGMNVVYSASAYPFGWLSDRIKHDTLLTSGLMILIAADLVLAADEHWLNLAFGVCLWGLHMGLTQGLLAAMVAHTAPAELRGIAYGLFSLVSGGAMLLASVAAGLLWDLYGASFTFYAGAIFAAMALAGLVLKARSTSSTTIIT